MGDRFEAARELWAEGVAIQVSHGVGTARRVAAGDRAGLARVVRIGVGVHKDAHEPHAVLGRRALRPRFRHAPAA
jgi:hypothetical protein